jgi:hypothetical protein
MLVSKTSALPLGDTPTVLQTTLASAFLPKKKWLGYQDSNLGMLVSKTSALPLGDTPSAAMP